MNMPTACRDKVIHVDKRRQQKAREYAGQITRDWFPRQDNNQHPREAAHCRVRHVVK